ncbi:MAG TPA: M20/M25/M40 family metallo-hydrolase [Thermoanaerobaculia bacterium]|nr:M20/M25/M40 family metallo-hydrolase [Thermoanaerobaculia bacterium]
MRRPPVLPALLGLFSSFLLPVASYAAAPTPPPAPRLSEAARWLQGYLQIDTSNPPGNEQKAADFLAAILTREGIATRRLVSPQGRTNLWARLSSPSSGGKAVLLLHHMDVVAPGPGWTVPPFAGQVKSGRLWGRGALDDKSLGVAQLAALVDLKRRGAPFARDVIFLAVADEESGGGEGTGWLMAHHPELFSGVEGVIGEGGRNQIAGGKLLWWGIEVAQKRPLWLSVEANGRGGHASGLNPASAVHQLVAGLARVLALPPRYRVSAPARTYLHALAPLHNEHWRRIFQDIDRVIGENGPKDFLLPGMENLFLDTVQVTVVSGGERINVIPAQARALIDVRLLPDTDAQALLANLKQALGKELEVKLLLTEPPSPPSPTAGRLYAAMTATLGRQAPLVPAMIPGFTDSHFFREKGMAAYGLSPFVLEGGDVRGIHSTDERIPLAELDRGVDRLRQLIFFYVSPSH